MTSTATRGSAPGAQLVAPGSASHPASVAWGRAEGLFAIDETVAHLDVLVERGWLTTTIIDGVGHYSRT